MTFSGHWVEVAVMKQLYVKMDFAIKTPVLLHKSLILNLIIIVFLKKTVKAFVIKNTEISGNR